MYTNRWESKNRATRRKAILLTLLFHFVLIGGLIYANNGQLAELVPDFIQEWFEEESTEGEPLVLEESV